VREIERRVNQTSSDGFKPDSPGEVSETSQEEDMAEKSIFYKMEDETSCERGGQDHR